MATRDIIDSQSNIIGQLTLPDETTEDVWATALAVYTYVPPTLTPDQIIAAQIVAQTYFGKNLMTQISANNIKNGINQSSQFLNIIQYTLTLQIMLTTGNLAAAVKEIIALINGGVPPEYAPFITVATLTATQTTLCNFLGIVAS